MLIYTLRNKKLSYR